LLPITPPGDWGAASVSSEQRWGRRPHGTPKPSLIGRARNSVAVATAAATAVCAQPARDASVPPDAVSSGSRADAQRSVTTSPPLVADGQCRLVVTPVSIADPEDHLPKGGETGEVTVLVVADTAYVRGDAFACELHGTRRLTPKALPAAVADPKTASGRRRRKAPEIGARRARLAATARLPETMLHGQRVVGSGTSKASGQPVTDSGLRVASPTLRSPRSKQRPESLHRHPQQLERPSPSHLRQRHNARQTREGSSSPAARSLVSPTWPTVHTPTSRPTSTPRNGPTRRARRSGMSCRLRSRGAPAPYRSSRSS
jgi:hypothetical protein